MGVELVNNFFPINREERRRKSMDDMNEKFLQNSFEWTCFLIGVVGVVVLIGLGWFGAQ